MRAFLKQFGWFMAIQLGIATLVVWSYARQFPAAQNYFTASIDKQSLLQTQAAPRLIFIGGSSMAFGVDSARIAEACGRRPVNLGLHAALGLKWLLREAEAGWQPGDWVIFAPEYQQFLRHSGQSEMLMNMVELNPANARLLDRQQWAEAFDTGLLQRAGKMTRAVLGRPGRFFRRGTVSSTKPWYRRVGFNQNGDVVAHLNAKRPGMAEREFTFSYKDGLVQEAILQINRFAQRAEERGVKVFFSHPPLPREVFEPSRRDIERLDAELAAKLNLPRLDRAEEMVFPLDDFFDTWYHLAASGREKRTRLLAARLAEQVPLPPAAGGR